MKFKRNLTVSFACHMTEIALCLIPMFLILGFSRDIGSFAQYCKDMFSVYFIALILLNVFLIALSIILSIFQKKTFTLNDEFVLIEGKGKKYTVNYSDVREVSIDLGYMGRMSSRSMELRLYGEKRKLLLSVTDPSMLMMHKIKKKCIFAKISYRNSKNFLWYLVASTAISIFVVVKSRL